MDAIHNAIGIVKDEPSAERTGRWEMVSQHGNPPTYIFRCSECGNLTFGMHKFCGECGARMKSEKE